ncbi:MAG: methyltransferase [Ornithinimicrobium sp.]
MSDDSGVGVPAAPAGGADQLEALRADLHQADYTVDHVDQLLGPMARAALGGGQRLPADLATRSSQEPAAILLRLWVLGLPVPDADVAHALPRTGADGAVAMGLAQETPADELRGTCDLRPYADERHSWWVASDLTTMATSAPLGPSHVVGVGGASTTLASWTPRPWAARTLDLGTGSGVQALHLAEHSAYRVVSDLSERALAFAAFTCALNEIDVDVRHGSLFEPVADEMFDLIVCNPPFVITPRGAGLETLDYRDGGAVGDGMVAEVVARVGEHLTPGGMAQFLGNWELEAGETWTARVDGWLPRGLDAWVVQREEQDVADYALTWARDAGHPVGTPEFDRWYAAWLEDFAARGVDRVGFGVMTVQRPSEDRDVWRALEDVRGGVAAPMGPAVLAGVRARSWLAMHDDRDVLAVPWSVAQDVTEERISAPGAPDPMVIQLRQGAGLRRVVRLDSLSAGLVGALDGELTAGQIAHALAALTDTALDEVQAAVVPMLRALVADGLLR